MRCSRSLAQASFVIATSARCLSIAQPAAMSRRQQLIAMVQDCEIHKQELTKTLRAAQRCVKTSSERGEIVHSFQKRVMINLMLHIDGWSQACQAAILVMCNGKCMAASMASVRLTYAEAQNLANAAPVRSAADTARACGSEHVLMYKAARWIAEARLVFRLKARTRLGVSSDRNQILRWLRLSWPEECRGARCARMWNDGPGAYKCGTYQMRRLKYIWPIKYGRLGRQAYMPPDVRRRRVANCETQNIPVDQFRAKNWTSCGPPIGGHFPAPILGPPDTISYCGPQKRGHFLTPKLGPILGQFRGPECFRPHKVGIFFRLPALPEGQPTRSRTSRSDRAG